MPGYKSIVGLLVLTLSFNQILTYALNTTGKCPSPEEVDAKTVDVEQSQGIWYDFIHYDTLDYGCSVYNYSLFTNESGTFRRQRYHTKLLNGSIRDQEFILPVPESKQEGSIPYRDESGLFIHYFLDIDYNSFALDFGCFENSTNALGGLWLQTRSAKTPDKEILQKIYDYNTNLGLNLNIVNYVEYCEGL